MFERVEKQRFFSPPPNFPLHFIQFLFPNDMEGFLNVVSMLILTSRKTAVTDELLGYTPLNATLAQQLLASYVSALTITKLCYLFGKDR